MKEIITTVLAGYFILINITGFTLMGIDKQKAIKKGWRVPERTLLLIAFLGGGAGSLFGMRLFRHKTKHMKFIILVPLSIILYVIIIGYISTRLG